MIKYYEGTVFNTEAKAIVNTVNCIGVMGAGVALEFKLRYPDMFYDYKKKCDNNKINIGKIDYYKHSENKTIVNFPTKDDFRFPSKLSWIEYGLQDFINSYKKNRIESIAFPKLGTSNGKLEWDDVKYIMEKYLSDLDIDIYICLNNKIEAEGVEKRMLEKLNSINADKLSEHLRISSKQIESISINLPYKRFWHLSKTKYIGKKTYESLFKYFYDVVYTKQCVEQLELPI